MSWKRFVVLIFCSLFLVMCSVPPGGGDGGVQPDKSAGKSCTSADDCKDGDCVNKKCTETEECIDHQYCKTSQFCYDERYPTYCNQEKDCASTDRCYKGMCEIKDPTALSGRCVERCNIDPDCETGNVCVNGLCHKPKWKTGKRANSGSTKNKDLRVGLGVVALDHPLGVSMAGYGFRSGRKSKYSRSLGGSTGLFERFNVKAMVIDDGIERIVLVRSPLVFTTDFLVTQIAQELIKTTGIDFTGKILITSTHSHSAPARFWFMLPFLGFGAFGGGDFHPEVFRRIVTSFTEAITKANKDLSPGKIGYTIDKNFDPEDKIFSDRRGASPRYKNPHLLVMRVEKAGKPIAALISYAMHGTINSSTMMTNDAPGGLEFKLQDRLEKKFKTRIEVFFMQGCAGDVSPRGDRLGHSSTQMMQMVGHLASDHIEKLFDKVKLKKSLTLEMVSRRIPLSRKTIGYGKDEFYYKSGSQKVPYRFGAFQCVGKELKDGKKYEDGKLKCAFSIEQLNGSPIPQFSKAHLTALRIGDLHISTYPGESSSWLGKMLREGLQKESKGKIKDVIVMGYSQDHHLYLLHEEDWWHGGYEASMSVWGPRFGNHLLKNAIALGLQLSTKEKEKNDNGVLGQDFPKLDMALNIPRLETPRTGKIEEQPPKVYYRMGAPIKFKFSGGYFGVDNPHAILQKKVSGSFKDVTREGGRLYDDSDYRMWMIFDFANEGARSVYTFFFEELESFPLGTYRFRVEGKKWEGGKRVAYKTQTDEFEIKASEKLAFQNIKLSKNELEVFVAYPAGTTAYVDGEFSTLKTIGRRLRSHLVHWEIGPPLAKDSKVQLKVRITGNGTDMKFNVDKLNLYKEINHQIVRSRDKSGKEKTSNRKGLGSGLSFKLKSPLSLGTYKVSLELTDAFGNKAKQISKEMNVN